MCWALCVLFGALFSSAQAQSFTDVTATWGVGDLGSGIGAAWGDYDADGDLDLYVVFSNGETNILYTNTGSAFTASGEAAQTGTNDNGATWGDYDGDGDLDLFTTDTAGNDFLWQNSGGSFTDVASSAGVQTGGDYSPGWVDYDRDGDLDLYVAVYGAANLLYQNDGSGSFVDVASAAGVANTGNTEGTAWGDYNNDGWPDLYIADNSAANVLYENVGDGTFTDVTSTATVGAGSQGIGASWGDYNNDGWLDLHVAYNSATADALYKNNGDGTFTEGASGAGVNQTNSAVSSVWSDFDLDGDLDLHVNISGAANLLYSNNGNGTFSDVAGAAGVNNAGTGRGSSWGDVDSDGDADLFVINSGSQNKLFMNTSTSGKSWLKVKLTGDAKNKTAIGALVEAWTGGASQRLQVEGVSSWNSQSSHERIFGFGSATTVDSVIVRWPSGQVSASFTPAVSTTLSLTEPALTVFSSAATTAGVNDASNSRSAAWADYDVDGDFDLYVGNQSAANKLYKNNNNSTFTDDATAASVNDAGTAYGVAWGDYDGDGFLDLFLANNGGVNKLYNNNGDGTFTEDGATAGVDFNGGSTGLSWGDYNNDGWVDLYLSVNDAANKLYNNNGDGTFTEVGAAAGVDDAGAGQAAQAAMWADYDGDGWPDLALANNAGATRLYKNGRDGTFTESASAAGIAAGVTVRGLSWADYNNDGFPDLYIPDFSGGFDALYENAGDGTFTDVAQGYGLKDDTAHRGAAWGDYDNDGRLDLFVTGTARNKLHLARANGPFSEVTAAAGIIDHNDSHAAVFGDYDGDGDLDLFVANNGLNQFYDNNGNSNNWLTVELEGTSSNAYGMGAVVIAEENSNKQYREIEGSSGYFSQAPQWAHFGFGTASGKIDKVTVVWSSGFSNVQTNIGVDQDLFITERAVVSQTPAAGTRNVARTSNVSATFSAAVTAVNLNTFIVHGSQTGELSGAYSGQGTDNPSFNPANDLLPGEEVEVRFADGTSAGLRSYRGTPVNPYIYRFTAAAGTGPAEFTSVFSSPFSSSTHAVDLGDVDGDGDLDLVVGNAAKQNAVYLNTSTGAMTAGTNNFGTGSDNTMSVDLGDLDGDGYLDIVAANINEQNTSHINNGSGGFAASANFGTGSDATRPIVLGDLDGDGYMDVAVGNDGAQNVVYFNDQAGALNSWSSNFGTGTDATKGLEIGDVDKDGDLDLWLGNFGEANKVYTNDGWGTFTAGNTFGTGSDQLHWLAVGDIDGDGDVDVVSANISAQSRPEINDGTGTFSAGTGFGASATGRGLKLGDVDGDGDLDAALSYDSDASSAVYLNNGSGLFNAGTKVFAGTSTVTMQVALGDLDGDADLDVVAGNNGKFSEVHFNSNAPTVSSTSPTAALASAPSTGNVAATFSVAVTAGDAASFVVHSSMRGKKAGVYSGNNSTTLTFNPTNDFFPGETVFSTLVSTIRDSSGNSLNKGYVWGFTAQAAVGPGSFTAVFSNFGTGSDVTAGIDFGDVDGDGDLDIALANQGGQSLVDLNDGAGNFNVGVRYIGGATDAKRKIELVDVDNDGDLDAAMAHRPGQNVVYSNDGAGNFASSNNFGTGGTLTNAIAFADLNGDGYLDVAVGNHNQQNIAYLNDGAGNLNASSANFGTGSDATYGLALADVDNDGDIDVAVGNNAQQDVVYFNDGSASFGTNSNFGTGSDATHWLDLADVDGDGDADVATASYGGQDAVYLNDGSGNFNAGTRNFGTGIDNTEYLVVGDAEGDGDVDVATGHWSQQDIVYVNDGSGNFSAGSNFGTGSDNTWVVDFADVDGDGDLDLASGVTGQNVVYLNSTTVPAPTVSSTSPTAAFASAPSTGNVTATFSVSVTAGDAASFVVHSSMRGKKAGAYSGNNSTTLTFNPTNDFFPGETVFSTLTTTVQNTSGTKLAKGYVWSFTVQAAVGPATFSSSSSADAASTYETTSASLGDLDGDGDLDLVTGNDNQVNRVYLGAGNGTFAAGNDVDATVLHTIAVALGDVDGDGDLDLIAGNGNSTGSGEVNRVYLGNGNGTFAAGSDVAAAANKTAGLGLGDLDADGDLDLVVANQTAVVNRVYLGNGNGTFDAGNDLSAATNNTRAVALGDLDGDGDIDLVTTNKNSEEQVYLSNGDGTFASGVNVSADTNQGRAVVLGDLDADGDLDLVVANNTQTNRIHLGNGNGTFAAGSDVDASTDGIRGLALGDLDGDSDLDLVLAKNNLANPFYLSNGNGTFAAASNVAADANLTRVVMLGDLDGDGDLDIVEVNSSATANRVYINGTGPSAPTVSSTSPTAAFSHAPSTGNVTATFSAAVTGGDAASFVVHSLMRGKKAGAYSGNNSTTLTFNPTNDFFPGETVFSTLVSTIRDGSGNSLNKGYVWSFNVGAAVGPGTFTAVFSSVASSAAYGVALGDLDGDGDLDAALANSNQQNVANLNDGVGNFSAGTRNFGTGSDNTQSLALGDIDGDGDLDVATGNYTQQDVAYLNDGSGNFTAGNKNFAGGSDQTRAVAFGDVDGDGDLDVGVGNQSGQSAAYLNDGVGNFSAGTRNFGPGTLQTLGIAFGDVDNDGDLDVANGNHAGGQNSVYLNDGAGNFSAGTKNFGTGTDNTFATYLSDVDGDGDLDVAATNGSGGDGEQNAVYLNDGSGNFTAGTKNFGTGSDRTPSVVFADVDGDGDLDAATGNGQSGVSGEQNAVYLNDGSGNFTAGTRNFGTTVGETEGLALGDVDGDGDLDIVAGNNGKASVVYYNAPTPFEEVASTVGVNSTGNEIGTAVGDFDGDGDQDIFVAASNTGNLLYQNNGSGSFTEVASAKGVNDGGEFRGAAFGDYDADGDLDLYVTRVGTGNLLYKNNGSGTFTDDAATAGVVDGTTHSLGASWVDYDGDGDLDLYLANTSAMASRLFQNNGSGVFSDVAGTVGVADVGESQQGAWADYDQDGDPDLYLTNGASGGANALYRNDSGGSSFQDVSSAAGVNHTGIAFGAVWTDYDNDGDFDIFTVADGVADKLYRNDGAGVFADVASAAGVADTGGGYGASAGDFDNDGDEDLIVSRVISARNLIYVNNGNGTFTENAANMGVTGIGNGRGTAFGDFDGDGDLDLFVSMYSGANQYYRNKGNSNKWLHVKLAGNGTTTNKNAIGVKVEAQTGSVVQQRVVDGGSGTYSQGSTPVEFGFGGTSTVDKLTVTWSDGSTTVQNNVATDQTVNITKGGGGGGGLSGGSGPGGVGKADGSTALAIWLKADANTSTTTDAAPVSSWGDASSSNNGFAQGTGSAQPLYKTSVLNGQPVLRFDGSDDVMATSGTLSLFASNTSPLTAFLVFNTSNNEGQKYLLNHATGSNGSANFELGYGVAAGTGSGNFGLAQGTSNAVIVPANTIANSTFNIMSLGVGSGSSPGNIAIYQNGSTLSPSNDGTGWLSSGSYPTGTDNMSLGARIYADNGTTDGYHIGDIAEVIVVKDKLEDVQRILVENYLSAKYAIALGANDVYVGDDNGNGDYDLEVFGMGKMGGIVHMQGTAGGLKLFDTGFLSDNGDWMLAGHASAGSVSWVGGDMGSVSASQRWNRIWYIDETDASANNGTLRISFDFNAVGLGTPAGSSGDYELLNRSAQTGDFLAVSGTSKSINGNVVEFQVDATNLADGYYTIGRAGLSETQVASGLTGVQSAAANAEKQIFHIGVTGDGTTSVDSLQVTIADLSTPTGLTTADINSLQVYRSNDATFDQGDALLVTQNAVNIGSSTTLSFTSDVVPNATQRFYIVVAKTAANPTDGHAFRVGFAAGGLYTSSGAIGTAVAASDADNVGIAITASKLAFTTQPSGSSGGAALTTQPVVEAQDANGNLDKDYSGTVTLTTTAGGTLSNATAAMSAGVATFSGLSYAATADSQSVALTAASSGLSSATATAFVADVIATKLVFATQPAGAIHATALTTQPVVQAQNASGILDTGMSGTVTLAASAGTLSGGTATMSAGVATFSTLAMSGVSSATTLTASFSSSGVSSVTSNSLAVAIAPVSFAFSNVSVAYDGQAKAIGISSNPSGVGYSVTYNGAATLPINPGTYSVAVTTTDANYTGAASAEFTILGPPAPTTTLSASLTTGPIPLTVQFTSVTTGQYTSSTLTTGKGDALGGFTSGSVTYTQPGTYTAELTVSGPGGSSKASTTIVALGPPTLALIGTGTAKEDEVLTLNLTGKDTGAGQWSVSGVDAAQIASSSVNGDIVSFTPVKDKAGTTTVTITRTASTGLSTPQAVTLTWTPVDDPPVFANLPATASAKEDSAIRVGGAAFVKDIDSDVNKFEWTAAGHQAAIVASATGGSNGVHFVPVQNAFGQSKTTLKVKDPVAGVEIAQEVTLTWVPVNDPPEKPRIAKPVNNARDVPLATVLSWSAEDVDKDPLKYDVFFARVGQAPKQVANGQAETGYSALGLEPGSEYEWRVVARDPSGATADTVSRFTTEADKLPPRISMLSATPVADGVRVVWETDEPAAFILNYRSAPEVATDTVNSGELIDTLRTKKFEVSLLALQSATWHDFSVRVRDRFQNESPPATGRFRTLAAPDTVKPNITPGSIAVNGITEKGVWIRWSTDELSTGIVTYAEQGVAAKLAQATDGASSGVVREQTLSRAHAIELVGLKPKTRYRFVAESVDASGNVSKGVEDVFETAAEADIVAPKFTLGPGVRAPKVESVDIELEADEVVEAEVRYDIDDTPEDGRVASGGNPATGHQVTLDGLLAGTTYSFQVQIVDVGGNQTLSDVFSFETRAAPDTTAPKAEGWRVVPSAERALLDFAFDEAVTARVSWWPLADARKVFFSDIAGADQRHKLTLGNLEAATDYAYEVVAADEAGNVSPPIADRFTTKAAPDTLPPVILKALVNAKRLESTVLLVDLNEVATLKGGLTLKSLPPKVEAGGATVGTRRSVGQASLLEKHRIPLTKLVPGAVYSIDFAVADPYGNRSAGLVEFKAPLRPDTEPPQLTRLPGVLSVSEAGARLGVAYNEEVQLSVRYFPVADGKSVETRNITQPAQEHVFELNGLKAGAEYRAELNASDAANLSKRDTLNFITLAARDTIPPVFTKLPWLEDAQLTSVRLRLETDEPVVADLVLTDAIDANRIFRTSVVERAKGHALEVTGLDTGAVYNYVLSVADANRNDTTATGQVRTIAKIVPPRIVQGPTRQRIGFDRAWLKLATNVPTRIVVDYFLESTPSDIQSEKPSARGKEHIVQLTNLLPDTTYAFSVVAVDDKAQLTSASVAGSFRTAKGPDITAPKIQGAPSVASIADTRAKIIWKTDEPSDSFVDVVGPVGKRTFSDPSPTLAHEVELTNLEAAAQYSYIVRSRDLAGNKTASSSFSFMTLAAPDTLPPQFARKPIVRSLGHDNAVIAYSANEPSSSTVDIGPSTAYELGTRSIADQVLDHEVRIDGLAAGTQYHLRVGLTDAQGNGPAFFPDFVVTTDAAPDTLAPKILTGPFAPPPTESQAIVEWTTDEPATRAVRYWKKDAPSEVFFSEEGALALTHRLVLSNLEAGAIYEYVAASSDEARNGPTESAVGEFRTQTRPQKPIFTGGPVAEADEASVTVTWTTNVPSNSIVDLGEDTQYGVHVEQADLVQDHEVVIKNLKAGVLYHYKVTSIDLAGNVLSTDLNGLELHSGDLTVRTLGQADTQPPRLIANPTTVWTDKSVVVSWETDEASTSRIEWEAIGQGGSVDQRAGFVEDNQLLFAHGLTLTGLKPRTLYAVKVISEDAAGNQMVWQPTAAAKAAAKRVYNSGLRTLASGKVAQPPGGSGTFVTDSFPDTRLPVITSGPRVREKSAESVTIEWQTDELSDSFVRFGGQETALQEVVGAPQDVQAHSVTLTNLSAGTSYFFQVESTDPSGNGASKSGIAVATTAAGADLAPPRYVREPRVIAATDVQATLGWTGDEAAAATIEYAARGGDILVRQVRERLIEQQVSLTNLLPNTEYRALITLRDANQNTTEVPFELSFMTDAEPDLTPPRFLSEPRIKVLGDRSVIIVWETDELSDSFVDFDMSPYLGQVVGDPTYTTQHEIRLTNLEPDSTYFFRAGSTDRAKNGPIESPVASFRTLAQPDTEPPAVPSAVRATAGPGAVLLQWDAVSASDLGGYTVYREDLRRRFVAVATGLTQPSYLDVGLTNTRTYRYRVSASDAQTPANESASSTVVTARPSEDAMGTPPQIIGLEQGAEVGKPVVMIGNAVPLDITAELSYTVQASTQQDFSTMVDRGGNIAESPSGTTRWRLTRALDPQTSYWFRARVSDGRFEGPWSTPQELRPADAVTATNSEDFDGDGTVGFRDFFIMANGFGSTDAVLDLDQGGSVDGEDFARFKARFGEVMPAKRLEAQRVAVAEGSRVEVEAEAISANRVIVRLKLAGVKDLSGYGFSIAADPPILRYIGRADSAVFGGRGASLELAHDGSVLAVGEHLRGRQASLDMSEGWEVALLFAMDGAPRNVDLRVEEGYLGTGRGRILRVEQEGRARIIPQVYALYANYPNPFNPSTIIPLAIPEWAAGQRRSGASLTLFNALGQVVRRWDLSTWSAGFHSLNWDGRDAQGRAAASGVYLMRLRAGDFVQVRKALLLR